MNKEAIDVAVVVKRVTDKALLVNFGAPKDEWVPKSQISDGPDSAPGYGTTSIFIPEWLAIEKGMV